MSDRQKENAERISAYLENKLSPTEREAFKRALSEDDGLRLQYIDALMSRAGTGASPAPDIAAEGQPGDSAGAEKQHAGEEMADEWMGIVRGAGGTRDEEKPDEGQVGMGGGQPLDEGRVPAAGQEPQGSAGDQKEEGHRIFEQERHAWNDTDVRGTGESKEIVDGATIGDSEADTNAGAANEDRAAAGSDGDRGKDRSWGAPRNWETGGQAVVTGTTGEGHGGLKVDAGGEGEHAASTDKIDEVHMQQSGDTGEKPNGGDWQTRGEKGVREAWEAKWQRVKPGGRSGFLGSRWMVGVAVLLLVIAGLVVIMMVRRQGFWERATAFGADSGKSVAGNGSDSAKASTGAVTGSEQADSGKTGSVATAAAGGTSAGGSQAAAGPSGAVSALADSVFTRLYRPYRRGDDPLEVRSYYVDYRKGNYAAVLAVGDSTGLGIGQRKVTIRDYMRLYRGLSFLATGDARDAVPELEAVVLRTRPGDILYETAQWYLALAWLKRTDVDATEAKNNALGLAQDVSNGYSRYSEPARQFVKELGQ